MKKINADIIADSKNEHGQRITTFILTYPRIIHAELLTHRLFSRNAASSRAIPASKMIKDIEKDPFIPVAWQKAHSGMQGTEYFTEEDRQYGLRLATMHDDSRHYEYITRWYKDEKARDEAYEKPGLDLPYRVYYYKDATEKINRSMVEAEKEEWLADVAYEIDSAKRRNERGVSKQITNRRLEDAQWYTCIVTATEYDNFFELRCPQYDMSHHNDHGGIETVFYKSRKDWLSRCGYPKSTFFVEKDGSIGPNCLEATELDWLKKNKGQGEIHISLLAEAMWDARNESEPKKLKAGEWHIPFGDKFDNSRLIDISHLEPTGFKTHELEGLKVKIATARCARVSYLNFEGKDEYEADIKLYDRLKSMGHMSPFEHCARAMSNDDFNIDTYDRNGNDYSAYSDEFSGWSGNFRGFVQLRKEIE